MDLNLRRAYVVDTPLELAVQMKDSEKVKILVETGRMEPAIMKHQLKVAEGNKYLKIAEIMKSAMEME